MKKIECPSCAMEVEAGQRICPVCSYEFTESQRGGYKWIAILLVLLFILYMIL